ncbi:MAG: NusG domain II-containing protein [Erysipelotrichaceae bacterium]|nr:NusG domain II-containing protein [Erysipelotrichaceae bacterium]
MKKKELLIVFILFLLGIGGLFAFRTFFSGAHTIEVRDAENKVLLQVRDDQEGIYTIEGKRGLFHLEVKDKAWRAVDVDCPDKICEHQGWITSEAYAPIICLPNGILVVVSDE